MQTINEIIDLVKLSMTSHASIIILKIKLKSSNEFTYGKTIGLGIVQPKTITPINPLSPFFLRRILDLDKFKLGIKKFEEEEEIDTSNVEAISVA